MAYACLTGTCFLTVPPEVVESSVRTSIALMLHDVFSSMNKKKLNEVGRVDCVILRAAWDAASFLTLWLTPAVAVFEGLCWWLFRIK